MDYLKKSRIEEVLIAILGKGTVTSQLLSRIEKILDAIRTDGSYDAPVMSEVEEILVCILNGEPFEKPTHSRIAAMLKVKANGGEYTELRNSRVEELIFEWINAVEYATYIGTLPATLQTVRGYLVSYKIYGNTVQNGTPTPENPITPSGCGELETTGAHAGQYKLPILSNSIKTDIYLGEVETTRKVKKLVLTGNESGAATVDNTNHIFAFRGIFNSEPELLQVGGICTHYKYNNAVSSLASNMQNGDFVLNRIVNNYSFTIKDNSFNTVNDFKSYLATQYANGTPVTVWYVLAEPKTGIVNEPLMKIGDYADTVSMEQAGVSIPTSAGSTTISWAGEGLAPSEVELTYCKPK